MFKYDTIIKLAVIFGFSLSFSLKSYANDSFPDEKFKLIETSCLSTIKSEKLIFNKEDREKYKGQISTKTFDDLNDAISRTFCLCVATNFKYIGFQNSNSNFKKYIIGRFGSEKHADAFLKNILKDTDQAIQPYLLDCYSRIK